MTVNIYQGTTLLEDTGLLSQGRAYVPSDSLMNFSGSWEQETVFFNSPLKEKVLSIAILNYQGTKDELPPEIENFFSLCKGAGSIIRRYDGSGYPKGNVIIALELGQSQPGVKYLGFPLTSKLLAQKIVTSFKVGLRLPYLPDPVSFDKPDYNLKLKALNRLFTPAVAIEWPIDMDIGPWLFASLMEYTGGGIFNVAPLLKIKRVALVASLAEPTIPPDLEPEPLTKPIPILPTQESAPPLPQSAIKMNPPNPNEEKKPQRRSAAMSPATYPNLYFSGEKKVLSKEPFC